MRHATHFCLLPRHTCTHTFGTLMTPATPLPPQPSPPPPPPSQFDDVSHPHALAASIYLVARPKGGNPSDDEGADDGGAVSEEDEEADAELLEELAGAFGMGREEQQRAEAFVRGALQVGFGSYAL